MRARQSPLVRGRETPRRRVSHQRLEASALLRVERPAYSIPFSGCTSEPVCAKSSCQPPYLREVIRRNSFRSPGYSMGSPTGLEVVRVRCCKLSSAEDAVCVDDTSHRKHPKWFLLPYSRWDSKARRLLRWLRSCEPFRRYRCIVCQGVFLWVPHC